MGRVSSRDDYTNPDILEDPAFIAVLEDSRPKTPVYEIFRRWTDGAMTREVAESCGLSVSGVQGHLQRVKAIYDIFAGRELTQYWEDYGLRRIVATRVALWRGNQKANGRQLVVAAAAFNKYYHGCRQRPDMLLAITTDEGIEEMHGVGPVCKELYSKARKQAVLNLIEEGYLEMLEELISLRNLIGNCRDEGDHTPVDLALAQLMDHGIFDEETFYQKGWKPLYRMRTGREYGISPTVLRRAYSKALQRRHPDVRDPMLVVITQAEGNDLKIRKCIYGVPEDGIKDSVKKLQKKGWQTGVSGKLPAMPARMIQIRKGDI